MAMSRDERDVIKHTGILAGVVLFFLVTAWTIAYAVW